MTIAVAGHVCIDLIPHWTKGSVTSLQPGKMVHTEGMEVTTGGSMANTGGALARLGMNPVVIGKVGSDAIGDMTLSVLGEVHDRSRMKIRVEEGIPSSYTMVLSPPDADRMFIHYPGPNDTFQWQDIPYDDLVDASIFHFGYPPLMKSMWSDGGENQYRIFSRLQQQGTATSLDTAYPDPQSDAARIPWDQWFARVLPVTDVFMPSLDELLILLKEPPAERLTVDWLRSLARRLHDFGAGLVGIKLGAEGLYLSGDTSVLKNNNRLNLRQWAGFEGLVPCYRVDVKGTTGAGDTAIAGFLTGLHQRMSPTQAACTAAGVAGFCVEAVSSNQGVPSLDMVERRMKSGWDQSPTAVAMDTWVQCPAWGIWRPPSTA